MVYKLKIGYCAMETNQGYKTAPGNSIILNFVSLSVKVGIFICNKA